MIDPYALFEEKRKHDRFFGALRASAWLTSLLIAANRVHYFLAARARFGRRPAYFLA